jgi:benzylsuccinate CoA-transferase BbsF subunit
MAPHNIFRCAGEDAWVAIAATTDGEWQALARVIDGTGLADNPCFATAPDRIARRDELERVVSAWTIARDADEAALALRQAGVPTARVANSRYLIESDPQLAARSYWQRVEHPELGNSLYASPPYRIDGERVELTRPPLLGEHNREILTGLLGLDAQEIDRLEASGVFK